MVTLDAAVDRWVVGSAEVDGEGVLGPTALVARSVAVASTLIDCDQVVAVSIEDLSILSSVRLGATLVITAAREREVNDQQVVSVVVRRGELGAQGGVAALGVLRFALLRRGWQPAPASAALLQTARRGAGLGETPVESSFRAPAGPSALANGLVMARVYETSLVSAQGFAGAQVVLDSVHALSVLATLRDGQRLRLQCSVVHAQGSRVTVLSHLVDDDTHADVLCALTSFRSTRPVPHLRAETAESRALARHVVRTHLSQAS